MVKKTQSNLCPICLEQIKQQANIDSCLHVFCQKCIKKWSNQENTCPVCKNRFHSIRKKAKICKKTTKSKKNQKVTNKKAPTQKRQRVKSRSQKSEEEMMEESIMQTMLGRRTRKNEQQLLMAFVMISRIALDQQ